jgi:hypothetical protein
MLRRRSVLLMDGPMELPGLTAIARFATVQMHILKIAVLADGGRKF